MRYSERLCLTLQKSIDFTPLLPRAGPTGGAGDAWPAPTMSLTMTVGTLAADLFDMSAGSGTSKLVTGTAAERTGQSRSSSKFDAKGFALGSCATGEPQELMWR